MKELPWDATDGELPELAMATRPDHDRLSVHVARVGGESGNGMLADDPQVELDVRGGRSGSSVVNLTSNGTDPRMSWR